MNFISRIFRQAAQFRDVYKGLALVSYSQQSEDLEIFRRFQGKPVGFYVDIGAFDPIQFSNTNLFYQQGWNGINVEPNPDNFDRFNKLRPRDINLNVGISDRNEKLVYYKFNAGALNTFDKEHAESWDKTSEYKISEQIEIQTYTLEEILDKYMPLNQPIDFLSVDCEGFDLKVIQSNNWQKYRPELVLVEESIFDNNSLQESPIYIFLKSVNYDLATITSGTMIYKRNR